MLPIRICLIVACMALTAGAHAQPAASAAGTGAASPADRIMMARMMRMNQAMEGAPMTGDADRDFVAMMIPHHQGAIDMAQVELRYGHDPLLQKLARGVVAAQEQEIAEMTAWQQRHHVK